MSRGKAVSPRLWRCSARGRPLGLPSSGRQSTQGGSRLPPRWTAPGRPRPRAGGGLARAGPPRSSQRLPLAEPTRRPADQERLGLCAWFESWANGPPGLQSPVPGSPSLGSGSAALRTCWAAFSPQTWKQAWCPGQPQSPSYRHCRGVLPQPAWLPGYSLRAWPLLTGRPNSDLILRSSGGSPLQGALTPQIGVKSYMCVQKSNELHSINTWQFQLAYWVTSTHTTHRFCQNHEEYMVKFQYTW